MPIHLIKVAYLDPNFFFSISEFRGKIAKILRENTFFTVALILFLICQLGSCGDKVHVKKKTDLDQKRNK